MARKIITLLVLVLAASLLVTSVFAKASWDKRSKVTNYDLSKATEMAPIAPADQPAYTIDTENRAGRYNATPLGAAAMTGPGPGEIVDATWEDQWKANMGGRTVEHRAISGTRADVHFVYDDALNMESNRGLGYNVYDAVAGQWPNLNTVGCDKGGDAVYFGRWPNVDVLPDGRAVMAGIYGQASVIDDIDQEVFTQSSQFSCFWTPLAGDGVPHETYNPLRFLDTSIYWLNGNQIEIQMVDADTVYHVVGDEIEGIVMPDGIARGAMLYFRKVGVEGTWGGGTLLDTTRFANYSLASSTVSNKVGIVYPKLNQYGIDAGVGGATWWVDCDLMYRESVDGGLIWGDRVNITNYDRSVAGWSVNAGSHVSALYSTDDELHTVFTAYPLPANPVYESFADTDDGDMADFIMDLFHWSQATTTVSKIAHGDYGHEVNIPICGFAGTSESYINNPTISECDGNMYVIFKQVHRDIITLGGANAKGAAAVNAIENLGAALDCFSGVSDLTIRGGLYGANYDIYVTVSLDMTGDLWDAPRNVTNTYTPECDSVGFGGICGNETKPSMARYGVDGAGLNWPANDVDLTPDGEGSYLGDYYLHMFYLDDQWPGEAWSDTTGTVVPFENSAKWLRLACVDPVTAAIVGVSRTQVEYPEHGPHGVETILPVTIYNTGNVLMDITEIAGVETSGSVSGWLGVSSAPTTVTYSDSATFNMILNQTGVINTGNPEFVDGYVYIKSNAKNNDSLVIPIHFLIADSLEAMVWDTVSTTDFGAKAFPFSGEFVGLAVNNIGSVGGSGLGGVNMDYTIAGNECDTTGNADVYLYDASLYLLRDNGSTVDMSTSQYATGFVDPIAFKPQVPAAGMGMQGGTIAAYDSVFTGTFANWDTTIAFERTYYAPRNNDDVPNFVIAKTVMYAPDGAEVTGLTVGSMCDWDIPSDSGSNNKAGISIPAAAVYIQGTDTTADPDPGCQENTGRFASEAFLGFYTATEYASDQCANNVAFHGAFANDFHEWYDSLILEGLYSEILDTLTTNVSLSAAAGEPDQAAYLTFLNDYTLPAGETVTFYTAYVTLKSGDLTDLEFAINNAKVWYLTNLRNACATVGACCIEAECYVLSEAQCTDQGGSYAGDGIACDPNPCLTCCIGTRGNIQLMPDCDPGDQAVDVSDLTNLIDHLFINYTDICCPDEGDIAPLIDGGTPDDAIDVSDLTAMIDHLFINYPDMPGCM